MTWKNGPEIIELFELMKFDIPQQHNYNNWANQNSAVFMYQNVIIIVDLVPLVHFKVWQIKTQSQYSFLKDWLTFISWDHMLLTFTKNLKETSKSR